MLREPLHGADNWHQQAGVKVVPSVPGYVGVEGESGWESRRITEYKPDEMSRAAGSV